jgi:glycosyltransferase involved in cell wall biosynthesis
MRIAYITEYDARDVHAWSGTSAHIARALEDQDITLDFIGNLKVPLPHRISRKFLRAMYLLVGKKHLTRRDPALARQYAAQILPQLERSGADLVFSPGSIPISYLDCKQPIVFWTDATFAGALSMYPDYRNFSAKTIADGNALEQAALDRCRLALYSSEWGARSAIENYRVSPDKVKVVPFGANLERQNSPEEVRQWIESRDQSTCKLLFVGVDWVRKGGAILLQIAEGLRRLGIPVSVAIVGCTPAVRVPDYVRVFGFLSKSSPENRKAIQRLYAESHFLVVPSRSEAFGIVFAEASAFGLPSIATNVGGIPSVIHPEQNGLLFSLDAPIEEYAQAIAALWQSPERYRRLAHASYREYTRRLTWEKAGETVQSLLMNLR